MFDNIVNAVECDETCFSQFLVNFVCCFRLKYSPRNSKYILTAFIGITNKETGSERNIETR